MNEKELKRMNGAKMNEMKEEEKERKKIKITNQPTTNQH